MLISKIPHANPNSVYREPNMSDVVFLGAFDGTNGGGNQSIVDSSTNHWTVTRSGSPYMGSMSPLSPQNWSVEFIGSSLHYLRVPASADFNFGTGDFTLEGWFYVNAAMSACDLIGNMTGTTSADWSVPSGHHRLDDTHGIVYPQQLAPLDGDPHSRTTSVVRRWRGGFERGCQFDSHWRWYTSNQHWLAADHRLDQLLHGFHARCASLERHGVLRPNLSTDDHSAIG
jgi:hypothetical protein